MANMRDAGKLAQSIREQRAAKANYESLIAELNEKADDLSREEVNTLSAYQWEVREFRSIETGIWTAARALGIDDLVSTILASDEQ